MPSKKNSSQDYREEENSQNQNGKVNTDSSISTSIDPEIQIEDLHLESDVGNLSKFPQPTNSTTNYLTKKDITYSCRILISIGVMGLGLMWQQTWIGWIGIMGNEAQEDDLLFSTRFFMTSVTGSISSAFSK